MHSGLGSGACTYTFPAKQINSGKRGRKATVVDTPLVREREQCITLPRNNVEDVRRVEASFHLTQSVLGTSMVVKNKQANKQTET